MSPAHRPSGTGLGVILGGARSGKSRAAITMAARSRRTVTFIATGEPRDEEMTERIARHRAERPQEWATVEAPVELAAALSATAPGDVVIVDCLSLWVANMIEAGWDDERIQAAGTEAARTAGRRAGPTIAVSNEVGMAIVPANALARRYRDVLGRVNGAWSAAATWTVLAAAGRLIELHDPDDVMPDLIRRIDHG